VGFPGNLGDLVVSTETNTTGAGDRSTNPPDLHAAGARAAWGEVPGTVVVPPSEGNEARREGRAEVGSLHRTCGVGELTQEDPAEERERQDRRLVEEKDDGDTDPYNILNATSTDSDTGSGDAGSGAPDSGASH